MNEPHDVRAEMASALRLCWSRAAGFQLFLYWVGAMLAVSGAVHVVVFLMDGGSWAGPVSWRKPIVFGFSFGLTVATLGWVLGFLRLRHRVGWTLAAIVGLASVGEVALITMQRWRGVPSHFNDTTPFDSVVFGVMGVLVVCIAVAIVVIAAWSVTALRASSSLGWGIRLGLLLLVAGQGIGVSIVANGSNTFGSAGSMTLPHAVTLHAIQVIPAMAWLAAFTDWSESGRLRLVAVTGAAYTLLAITLALQTYRGLAPFDLGLLEMVLIAAGTVTLLGAGLITANGLRQPGSERTLRRRSTERKT